MKLKKSVDKRMSTLFLRVKILHSFHAKSVIEHVIIVIAPGGNNRNKIILLRRFFR